MVKPVRFCHVVYRTYQLDTMVEWYLKVFEARVQHRSDKICFMTYDDEHHRFAIAKLEGPVQEGLKAMAPSRVAHVAYAWKNLDELLDTYKRLKAHGILPVRPIRHGLTLSMYYQDPDGNGQEFQIDLLDEEAAAEYMAGEEFAENPSGELFDPDELVAAYESGKAVDAMIFRAGQYQKLGSRYVRGKPQQPYKLRKTAATPA